MHINAILACWFVGKSAVRNYRIALFEQFNINQILANQIPWAGQPMGSFLAEVLCTNLQLINYVDHLDWVLTDNKCHPEKIFLLRLRLNFFG